MNDKVGMTSINLTAGLEKIAKAKGWKNIESAIDCLKNCIITDSDTQDHTATLQKISTQLKGKDNKWYFNPIKVMSKTVEGSLQERFAEVIEEKISDAMGDGNFPLAKSLIPALSPFKQSIYTNLVDHKLGSNKTPVTRNKKLPVSGNTSPTNTSTRSNSTSSQDSNKTTK